MKNVIAACVLVLGVCNLSVAGECFNGLCKPVRKVVNITKEVVVAPVNIVADTTRNIVKYQPIRRRLVNSTTVYHSGCSNCR
jgi:hypothetical protein